jgi:hypothetical protein
VVCFAGEDAAVVAAAAAAQALRPSTLAAVFVATPPARLQRLGATALYVAAKLNETANDCPSASFFAEATDVEVRETESRQACECTRGKGWGQKRCCSNTALAALVR